MAWAAQKPAKVLSYFLGPRSGQDSHQRPRRVAIGAQKLLVEPRVFQLVKVGVAHERGVTSPLAVPGLLERQFTQHVIDQASHLAHPPGTPCPQLRHAVVNHRDAMGLGPPRDPPIEARIVNQHNDVRTLMPEIAVGPADQFQKPWEIGQGAGKPHHGQSSQVCVQFAPGRRHSWPAVPDRPDTGIALPQLSDQIRAVQIATGLSHREKHLHRNRSMPEMQAGFGAEVCQIPPGSGRAVSLL